MSRNTILGIFLLALIAATPLEAERAEPALDQDGHLHGLVMNWSLGWAFDVLEPLTVLELGVYDIWPDTPLDADHAVGIWSKEGVLLASVVVERDARLERGYRFEPIPPLDLPVGGYLIGATFPFPFVSSGRDGGNVLFQTTIRTIKAISYKGARFTELGPDQALTPPGTYEPSDPTTDVLGPNFTVSREGACHESPTVACLNQERFRVAIEWRRPPEQPDFDSAFVSDLGTDHSALFHFRQDASNLEFLVKVLDGCHLTNHYWLFFAGTTDVEFALDVEDTQSGETLRYTNPAYQSGGRSDRHRRLRDVSLSFQRGASASVDRVEHLEATLPDQGPGVDAGDGVLHLDADRVLAVAERRGVEQVLIPRQGAVREARVKHGDTRVREAVGGVGLEHAVDQDAHRLHSLDVERPAMDVDGATDQDRTFTDLDVAERVEVGVVLDAEEGGRDLVDVGLLAGDVAGADDDVVGADREALVDEQIPDVDDEPVACVRRVRERRIEAATSRAG